MYIIHFIFVKIPSVTLVPFGFVPVCLNGEITLTCSTSQGTLLWESVNFNQFFNMLQSPVTKGNFTLSVTSVEQQVVGGMTVVSVNSTATLSNFQSEQNGSSISCVETTTNLRQMAIFIEISEILNTIFILCVYAQWGYVFGCVGLCRCMYMCPINWLFDVLLLENLSMVYSIACLLSLTTKKGGLLHQVIHSEKEIQKHSNIQASYAMLFKCKTPTCNCSADLQYRYR